MPAKDLGTKWTCFKCGTKFYDLKKPEPICPKCGANAQESPALKATPADKKRAAREVAAEAAVEERAEEEEVAEEEAETEEAPPPDEEGPEEEDLDA